MTSRTALCLVVMGLTAPRPTPGPGQEPLNALTAAEQAAGWRLLFDGKTTTAWRGFRHDSIPAGWQARDGALTRVAPAGDIITRDRFANFELTLEWNISPAGNSGIFYRVGEDDDATYWSGPEMQVLDDAHNPDGRSRLTAAGSCYAVYPAPAGVVKAPGQWNRVRLVVAGHHVEQWLNGIEVVTYELGSPDWEARVKASKFATHPHYGRYSTGYIGLQDHGDWVAYRNIKVRVLP